MNIFSGVQFDVILPFTNSSSTQLSHNVWPQMFTSSFSEGFRYFVVLHRGQPSSSIFKSGSLLLVTFCTPLTSLVTIIDEIRLRYF